jgi:2-polyprenyl-6-methoxyphenol hydroxylase-like FAD-dependent oxidoreductase
LKIRILGAGPAGLYAGYRLKRLLPSSDIMIVEQNPQDVTFGFGVVLSAQGLQFLSGDDPDLVHAISSGLEAWDDIEVRIGGQRVRIDGIGFTAIARLELLRILHAKTQEVGLKTIYDKSLRDISEFSDADLIIAADGANSLVRRTHEQEFGTKVENLTNWFAWFGAARPYDALTQTVLATNNGPFNAHHYRFCKTHSTFLVETTADNYQRLGLQKMTEEESRVFCQGIFDDTLEGAELLTNRSIWRQFPKITNERWSHQNMVLVGDALRTAHYSIGSGTRLALEDVQALVGAIQDTDADIPSALQVYEERRKPIVAKLLTAAARSANWYESFDEKMNLAPLEFAHEYISRSGRVDPDKLASTCPNFVNSYLKWKNATKAIPSS